MTPAAQPSCRIAYASTGVGSGRGSTIAGRPSPRHHLGGVAGEHVGLVPGVVADDDRAAAVLEQVRRQPRGGPDHDGPVHPVRSGAEPAAQPGGAELEPSVEPVGQLLDLVARPAAPRARCGCRRRGPRRPTPGRARTGRRTPVATGLRRSALGCRRAGVAGLAAGIARREPAAEVGHVGVVGRLVRGRGERPARRTPRRRPAGGSRGPAPGAQVPPPPGVRRDAVHDRVSQVGRAQRGVDEPAQVVRRQPGRQVPAGRPAGPGTSRSAGAADAIPYRSWYSDPSASVGDLAHAVERVRPWPDVDADQLGARGEPDGVVAAGEHDARSTPCRRAASSTQVGPDHVRRGDVRHRRLAGDRRQVHDRRAAGRRTRSRTSASNTSPTTPRRRVVGRWSARGPGRRRRPAGRGQAGDQRGADRSGRPGDQDTRRAHCGYSRPTTSASRRPIRVAAVVPGGEDLLVVQRLAGHAGGEVGDQRDARAPPCRPRARRSPRARSTCRPGGRRCARTIRISAGVS